MASLILSCTFCWIIVVNILITDVEHEGQNSGVSLQNREGWQVYAWVLSTFPLLFNTSFNRPSKQQGHQDQSTMEINPCDAIPAFWRSTGRVL